MSVPKKVLVPYLVLRSFSALAVGVTVAFGLFLGAEVYGRFEDELVSLAAVSAPPHAPLQAFPQDTAELKTMAKSMVAETTDLATTAAEMQKILPAAGDAPSSAAKKPEVLK